MVAQAGMLRAEAEAKALRAQFSPHFIFNVLHSMIQLVRGDPDAAERSIEDMASLIRYGSLLQKRSSDTVPLAVEIAVAKRYLALEQIRLGDRLRATLDVEDGMSDVAVPALTLQTLLENAVKHGISPRPEGGSLHLSVHGEGDGVVLTVQDDGAGADAAALADDAGSGLKLLSRRLRNIYGPDTDTGEPNASLEWKTAPGAGFTATVRLPRREAEAMDVMGPFRSGTAVG